MFAAVAAQTAIVMQRLFPPPKTPPSDRIGTTAFFNKSTPPLPLQGFYTFTPISAMRIFMSSQTSRLAAGFRSR